MNAEPSPINIFVLAYSFMKKIIGIIILSILLNSTSFAGVKKGKGEVEMSNRAVERFITYLRGKKGMKPSAFILSSDGSYTHYWYCPHTGGCRDGNYEPTIRECEEKTGVDCGLFARKRTIVWKNDINSGKGKASKINSKWSDTEIRAKLTELGFLGGSTSSTPITTTPKIIKKIDSKKYTDGLTYFSKCTWSSDENDYHNSFEVDLKKETIEDEFFAEGEIYKDKLKIIQNNDDFIKTKIEEYGDNYNQYIFNKKNNEITNIMYKDKKGKVQTDKYLLFCKDIFGTLNIPKIEKKVTKKKLSKADKDIVKKLKDLKELLDSGVLTKEEFKKAKKKLLN